jgi:hypothetical protein
MRAIHLETARLTDVQVDAMTIWPAGSLTDLGTWGWTGPTP